MLSVQNAQLFERQIYQRLTTSQNLQKHVGAME